MASVTAIMVIEKETKNTIRYAESDDSPGKGAIGILYLTKFMLRSVLGQSSIPSQIKVTVEVGE